MNPRLLDAGDRTIAEPLYHGTRADLKPGDRIEPCPVPNAPDDGPMEGHVYLTRALDAAIWAAELACGLGPGRVYVVEPLGAIEEVDEATLPKHPSMAWRSRQPLRVIHEVTQWSLYHGTRANLQPGDFIEPGRPSNYGKRKQAEYVYLTATLDAATWGAELAVGESAGRIYTVEPTGPIEDDPDLTNRKFRGNPTRSYRSRHPLRVTGEVTNWRGHSPAAVAAINNAIERIEARAAGANDEEGDAPTGPAPRASRA